MKKKRVVGFAVLMCAVLTGGYWIGYEHGRSPSLRIKIDGPMKQVGLSFRNDRNDITRFTATGTVTVARTPVEGR